MSSLYNVNTRFLRFFVPALVVVIIYSYFFTALPSKLPRFPHAHVDLVSKHTDNSKQDIPRSTSHAYNRIATTPSTRPINAESARTTSQNSVDLNAVAQFSTTQFSDSMNQASSRASAQSTAKPIPTTSPMAAVANATLGFERIIAINLPERTDRRDVLTLMTSINDIHLEWQDAVKGTDMVKEAWPSHWDKKLALGELGSWRSHLSALRRVVEEGYSSALIIEDDADWDVSFKSQLRMFAEKTRILGNVPLDKQTPSPYGDAWDLLWLGECATPPGPPDSQLFPGVGDQDHWVFRTQGGMACIYGYAVTQRSARMLMGWLLDIDKSPDFAYGDFCANHRCITVWPELIGSHKSAGSPSRDSSISNHTGQAREKGETRNVVNSAILDMLKRIGPSPNLRKWPT